MTSIPYPPALIGQFALETRKSQLEGYYRSKLFVLSSSGNPLIAAAGPVFSLLERLGLSTTLPHIKTLRHNIEHELHAFQSRLVRKSYAEELIFIAHYLLCATVDELIGKSYLRVHGKPVEFVAFTPLSSENQGPQRYFFDIVDLLKDKTNQYLDLLELAYYCLITGFEGEKHVLTDGRQALENLIEELHQLINQYRVHKPNYPFKEKILPLPVRVNHKPIAIATLMTLGVILVVCYLSHARLEHKAHNMLLTHQSIATPMESA